MNHRRAEHPTKRNCRYFLNESCKFKDNTCWYRHELEPSGKPEEKKEFTFTCNQCEKIFNHRQDLMMHKKGEHREKVAKCRHFVTGQCNLKEKSC